MQPTPKPELCGGVGVTWIPEPSLFSLVKVWVSPKLWWQGRNLSQPPGAKHWIEDWIWEMSPGGPQELAAKYSVLFHLLRKQSCLGASERERH